MSHARKNSRVRKCYMSVVLVLCLHLPSLTNEIAIACERNTVQVCVFPKQSSLFIPTRCLPPVVWWLPPWRRRAWWGSEKDTISIQFSGQLVRLHHCILRTVDSLFAVLVCSDGFLCPSFSRLFEQSLFDSDGFGVAFTVFHRTVFTLAFEYRYPTVFTYVMLFCGAHVCMIFLLKFRRSVRRMLRPIQSRSVTLCKSEQF